MLAAVIPARNEAARIQDLLREVLRLPLELVIPVLNGCTDLTAAMVERVDDRRIQPLIYRDALGYDVPRIAGATAALEAGARAVLFVDGDLAGRLTAPLTVLLRAVTRGTDLALCDCYADTPVPYRESAASEVYRYRVRLNKALGRPDLGAAIPSHGPVAVSRRLLETVPVASLGVPPLMQAHACKEGLTVKVLAPFPHRDLGSAPRDRSHRRMISETIIGDCIQALCLAEGKWPDRQGYIGYHEARRFDLLGLEPPEATLPNEADAEAAEPSGVTPGPTYFTPSVRLPYTGLRQERRITQKPVVVTARATSVSVASADPAPLAPVQSPPAPVAATPAQAPPVPVAKAAPPPTPVAEAAPPPAPVAQTPPAPEAPVTEAAAPPPAPAAPEDTKSQAAGSEGTTGELRSGES